MHASGEVDMRRKLESEPGELEMSIRSRKSTATLNPLMSKKSYSTSKSPSTRAPRPPHKERENSVATRVKMDSRSTGSSANGFRSKTPISSKNYTSKRKEARKKLEIAAPYHSSMLRTINKSVPNVTTSDRTQYFANTTTRLGDAWETPTDESPSRHR